MNNKKYIKSKRNFFSITMNVIMIFTLVLMCSAIINHAFLVTNPSAEVLESFDDAYLNSTNSTALIEQEIQNEFVSEEYILSNVTEIINHYTTNTDIAISFTDFTTNAYIGFNDDIEFLGASTTKLPLALFICDKLETGELSLTDTISYSYADYEEGAGVMFDSYNGQPYTIQTLLENMLVHSDNIATNMFYRHFGYSETKQAIGDLVGIEIDTNENIITSKQMNEFIKFLYNNKNKPYYEYVINLLTTTDFHDRLDRYIPYDLVAHKIGNYEGNTHDVGIVLLDTPYSLSIYTDNITNAEEIISSLSKDIYDFYCSL